MRSIRTIDLPVSTFGSDMIDGRDGREGHECRDCGAYLQWARYGDNDYLRCPWVRDLSITTSAVEHGIVTRIYCEWPKSARVPGGVPTVMPRVSR